MATSHQSAVGQVDVEAVNTQRENNPRFSNPHYSEAMDVDFDEENMPSLSSFVSEWTFWWKFSVWPIVLGIFNGIVFGTLLVYDEYGNRYHGSIFNRNYGYYDPYGYGYDSNQMGSTTKDYYLKMLRYNSSVFAVMLLLDAALLFYAAKRVQEQVEALDDALLNPTEEEDLILENDGDTTRNASTSNSNRRTPESNPSQHRWRRSHIHGQVSRKLDEILRGGEARPRDSILVSLLIVFAAASSVWGVMSGATWAFTWTGTAHRVCNTTSYSDYDSPGGNESNIPSNEYIPGLPQELQDWATVSRYSTDAETMGTMLQREDGTIFVAAVRPSKNEDRTAIDMYNPYEGRNNKKHLLASIHPNGTAHFFSGVTYPEQFVSLSTTDKTETADLPIVPGFCCFFKTKPSLDFYGQWDVNLLCLDSSDDISSIESTGIFRNATLDSSSVRDKYNKKHSSQKLYFEQSDLKWCNNGIWIRMVWGSEQGRILEIYNLTLVDNQPLKLVLVISLLKDHNSYRMDSYDMIGGEARSCAQWRNFLQRWMLIGLMLPVGWWLWKVRGLAAGVVPVWGSIWVLLIFFNSQLATALSVLVASLTFLTLQGCSIPFVALLSSEQLVWLLYSTVLSAANSFTYRPEEFAVTALIACVIIGTIMGHPTMYLAGWIGGISTFLTGIFFCFVGNVGAGFLFLSVGSIGGAGCVTVGSLLIKYRAYIKYYTKRAWTAVNGSMQSATHRDGFRPTAANNLPAARNDPSLVSGLLHREG